ncbi:MAG: hypothetical protein MJZ93_04330 [Paludibacteraceae bacterium]|nr:hypothetical protein [Paludibacteraceae bacterium]
MKNKRYKIIVAFASIAFVFLCVLFFYKNVHFVFETEYKHDREADAKLTYVTISELKEVLNNDEKRYKILVFSKAFKKGNWWSDEVEQIIIPKYFSTDTAITSLYLIAEDCSYTDEMDDYFRRNKIMGKRYVIRDDSQEYSNNGASVNRYGRLNRILRTLSNNTDLITKNIYFANSIVLDSANNAKLFYCHFNEGENKQCAILPMPFEMIDDLDEIDFNEVEHIDISKNSDSNLILYFI